MLAVHIFVCALPALLIAHAPNTRSRNASSTTAEHSQLDHAGKRRKAAHLSWSFILSLRYASPWLGPSTWFTTMRLQGICSFARAVARREDSLTPSTVGMVAMTNSVAWGKG